MNNIKALRLEKDWSQAELAQRLGVNQTAVSKWELGNSLPDMKSTRKLAELFNVSVDYIHGLVEDERTRKIDYLKPPQATWHGIKESAKRAGLPTEFFYQFASVTLPPVYYQLVEKYRIDDYFRKVSVLWDQLAPVQRNEVVKYMQQMIDNTNKLIVEGKYNLDSGYLPPDEDGEG